MSLTELRQDRCDHLGDDALVGLARRGSPGAIRAIIQRNNQRLFRAVRSILKDEAEAEDALQDAYVRALSNLEGFKGEAGLSTWLMRIAINEALGRLRRRREMIDIGDHETELSGGTVVPFKTAHGDGRDPEHAAARSELRRLLEAAIDALPEPFRLVFVLHFVEQVPVAEISAQLGLPENTVKTRLFRARRHLRESLGEQIAASLGDTFPFAGARCARLGEAVLGRLGLTQHPSPD